MSKNSAAGRADRPSASIPRRLNNAVFILRVPLLSLPRQASELPWYNELLHPAHPDIL